MRSSAARGRVWSGAGYGRVALQETMARPLWEAMLAAAAVGPGSHVLDAGCGAGGASVLAAGRGAYVNGLDAAPALLTIARKRVPDGDFRVGALEALPYADETFDAVIIADALPYVADSLAVLRELRRVCAAHGRVVVAVVSAAEDCAQYVVAMAMRRLLAAQPDGDTLALSAGDTLALSAPGALDALLVQAGLHAHGEGHVVCPAEYPDREVAWLALASTGPLQAALRAVDVRRLKAEILAALAPHATNGGRVCCQNCYRYVVAMPAGDRRAER